MSLPDKRTFLASVTNPATGKPFAIAGSNGKFSNAANEYAAANPDKWAAPAPVVREPRATPTVTTGTAPATARVKAPAAGSYDAKEVRSWAAQNGHEVGARGRIPSSVITAFLKADGAVTVKAAARPTPAVMPKRRPESSGFTTVGGILIRQDRCGACPQSVSRCACPNGPQALPFLSKIAGAPLALTLDKPAL